MDDIIIVNDLKKTFGSSIKAVDGISFRVKRGEIFGFLGPNGAGKSTTIKILTTLIGKGSGTVTVDGIDIDSGASEVRKIIGYASQEVGVDDDLTARENLLLQCKFHHIPKETSIEKVVSLLDTIKLTDSADRKVSTFSGGMRKRLDLATALVSDPKILFLDEPTTGLDPQSRKDIWEYVRELNRKGTTIFLTTQYMEEADQLSNRLCIVDQGKIVLEGTPKELKSQIGADTIEISFMEDDPTSFSRAKQVLQTIKGVKEIKECEIGTVCENGLMLMVENGSTAVPQVVRELDAQRIGIKNLTLSTPSLDDVFLKMTGKKLKVIEATGPAKSGWGRRRRGP
jgi:ABC-2 type transport system ATP-binding protein